MVLDRRLKDLLAVPTGIQFRTLLEVSCNSGWTGMSPSMPTYLAGSFPDGKHKQYIDRVESEGGIIDVFINLCLCVLVFLFLFVF